MSFSNTNPFPNTNPKYINHKIHFILNSSLSLLNPFLILYPIPTTWTHNHIPQHSLTCWHIPLCSAYLIQPLNCTCSTCLIKLIFSLLLNSPLIITSQSHLCNNLVTRFLVTGLYIATQLILWKTVLLHSPQQKSSMAPHAYGSTFLISCFLFHASYT